MSFARAPRLRDALTSLTLTRGVVPAGVRADEEALTGWLRGPWRVVEVLDGSPDDVGFVGALLSIAEGRMRVAHPLGGYLGAVEATVVMAAREHRMGGASYPFVGILEVRADGEVRREAAFAVDGRTLHLTWNDDRVRLRLERASR